MGPDRSAEIAGQQDRAEHRSARKRIESGAEQRENAERAREAWRDADLFRRRNNDIERDQFDDTIEEQEQDHQAAHDAAGPARGVRDRNGLIHCLQRHFPHFTVGAHSQLISQGVPKRSVKAPKRLAQNVCCNAISTVPLSVSAAKIRSASAVSLRLIDTEKPCIGLKRSGGASDAISV